MHKRRKQESGTNKRGRGSSEPVKEADPPIARDDDSNSRDWNSKQARPANEQVLKYVLTVGHEISESLPSVKKNAGKTSSLPVEGLAVDDHTSQLIEAVFTEIENGEASLARDKGASRVLENLIRYGDIQRIVGMFERLKPYVGSLVYDHFASHVMQQMITRCSTPSISSKRGQELVQELCAQISLVDEWWPLMHDRCGTHVARSCIKALSNIAAYQELDKVYQSLSVASVEDLRKATRDSNAAPFVSVAISHQDSEGKRESLVSRIFFERDGEGNCTLDRRSLDQCIQDKTSSRVLDQTLGCTGDSFLEDTVMGKLFAPPHLVNYVKHPFANFVVQRVVEKLIRCGKDTVERVLEELNCQLMLELQRTGVITSTCRLLAAYQGVSEDERQAMQMQYCEELVQAGALNVVVAGILDKKTKEDAEGGEESVDTNVNLSLSEAIDIALGQFHAKANQPVVDAIIALDEQVLFRLAKDPVGGRRIIEPVFDRQANSREDRKPINRRKKALASRFQGYLHKLAIDRFGVHVVKKCFHFLAEDVQVKVMSEEIVANKVKILGAPGGKALWNWLLAPQFVRNRADWKKAFNRNLETNKQAMKEEWAKELGLDM